LWSKEKMDTKENILQELKEHSLVLYQIKTNNTSPFKVPEGYFSTLQAEILSASEIGLSDQIGKNAFKVPKKYFENLSENIFAAIEQESIETVKISAPKPKVIEINRYRKRHKVRPFKIYAMVAAIAGLFLFMTFLNDNVKKTNAIEVSLADTTLDDLEDAFTDFEQDNYALVDLTSQSIDLSMTDEFENEFAVYFDEDLDENEITRLYNDI
jgi:hypothetical protein